MPKVLRSDRDSKWCSAWFKALMKHFNVRQAMGTSHDHKFNGVVENVNKTVEVCLRSVLANYPDREFTDYLPLVQFAINSAKHTATKESPYKAVFGVEPCSPSLFAAHSAATRGESFENVKDFVEFQEGVLQMTRDTLLDSQRAVAIHENRVLKDIVFEEGEKVYLSSKNLSSIHFQRPEVKLQSPFLGPFEVVKKLSPYTYRLKLPVSMKRLHPVFHAVLLSRSKDEAVSAENLDEFRDRLSLEGDESLPLPVFEQEVKTKVVPAKLSALKKGKSTVAASKKVVPAVVEPLVQSQQEEEVDGEQFFFERILERKKNPSKKYPYRYKVRWSGYDSSQDSWITKNLASDDAALEMIRKFDADCDTEERRSRVDANA